MGVAREHRHDAWGAVQEGQSSQAAARILEGRRRRDQQMLVCVTGELGGEPRQLSRRKDAGGTARPVGGIEGNQLARQGRPARVGEEAAAEQARARFELRGRREPPHRFPGRHRRAGAVRRDANRGSGLVLVEQVLERGADRGSRAARARRTPKTGPSPCARPWRCAVAARRRARVLARAGRDWRRAGTSGACNPGATKVRWAAASKPGCRGGSMFGR